MCNAFIWRFVDTSALMMLGFATVLGVSAFALSVKEAHAKAPDARDSRSSWRVLAVLLVLHAVAGVIVVRAVPAEAIDCYTFQREAAQRLLHGIDPFGGTEANVYDAHDTSRFYGSGMVLDGRVQVGFQYPPITLLWVLPGYLLGDVRYSYIVAVMFSAVFLFAIYPHRRSAGIAALLLLNPFTFYVESRSWTEPLVLMVLSATLYAAMKQRAWLPFALGLFLATKQYNFLALPFMGFLIQPFQWRSFAKLMANSLVIAAATAVPFAMWNIRGLWHDLVLFHLAQPFRSDALSFAVPFPLFLKVGPLLCLAFMVWGMRVGKRHAAMFAAGYGIALLLFVSTSKQAFSNYYFLIAQALLLAAAALANPSITAARIQPDSLLKLPDHKKIYDVAESVP